MDSRRFDALSRALARRQRARLLAPGAPAATEQDAQAQETEPGLGEDGICRMVFEATVRVRTSLFGSAPEVTRGVLELDIGDNGGITGDSRLVLVTAADRTQEIAAVRPTDDKPKRRGLMRFLSR